MRDPWAKPKVVCRVLWEGAALHIFGLLWKLGIGINGEGDQMASSRPWAGLWHLQLYQAQVSVVQLPSQASITVARAELSSLCPVSVSL